VEAAAKGAQVIVLQELFRSMYSGGRGRLREFQNWAEAIPGPIDR